MLKRLPFDPMESYPSYSITPALITVSDPDYPFSDPPIFGSLRSCTEEDFIKVNALHIWKEKFPDGEANDKLILCSDIHESI